MTSVIDGVPDVTQDQCVGYEKDLISEINFKGVIVVPRQSAISPPKILVKVGVEFQPVQALRGD